MIILYLTIESPAMIVNGYPHNHDCQGDANGSMAHTAPKSIFGYGKLVGHAK